MNKIIEQIIHRLDSATLNKKVYKALTAIFAILGALLILNILFPTAMTFFFNIIWIVLLAGVVTFFILGILVIMGLKDETSQILDILLEGSLTLLDVINYLKRVWKNFLELLKELLVYASPIFAYITTSIIYVTLLIFYKSIGKTYDVTALTLSLTIMLVAIVGLLSGPIPRAQDGIHWLTSFKRRFRSGFIDGFEVILFLFFLTLDSTNLFFLPQSLNIPLKSALGSYDFMIKGFVYSDHLRITINLIIATIVIEVVRNIMRIVALAKMHYSQLSISRDPSEHGRTKLIKLSIRKSFGEAKDDIIKFITFTTILVVVFLFFPRLKLLTLLGASSTMLILDILNPKRLTYIEKADLVSRILTKVFRL